MTVAQISQVTKRKYRVLLDDGSILPLYAQDLKDHDIREGEELAKESYDTLIGEILPKRAKLKLLDLLARRSYTEYQLGVKLSQAGFPQDIIDSAMAYVRDMHFMDDYEYSRDYIFSNCSRKSRMKMINDLKLKGVDDALIQEAMDSVDEDGDLLKEDEFIYKLMSKRHYDAESASYEERQKMYAYLYGKGFDAEAINRCMKQ